MFPTPKAFLDDVQPASPVQHVRLDLASELLADVGRLDQQLKDSHQRIRVAVTASNTTLTDIFGVGPVVACALIGYTRDVRRFANCDQEALRSLKRQVSNAVYRQLLIDATRAGT